MRILMLAPEPFFMVRGTPLSILSRLRALSESGHLVDVVCYPHGEDIELPGVRLIRPARPFWIHKVPIGFSLRKLRLDLGVAAQALRLLACRRYDLLFTHEEAVLPGALLRRVFGLPHLYDMHSSLPDNLAAQGWLRRDGVLYRAARSVERSYLRQTDAVVAICDSLGERARAGLGRLHGTVRTMENLAVEDVVPPRRDLDGAEIRRRYGIPPRVPLCVYTGNAARVQGLDLLMSAFRLWRAERREARLLLVGPGRLPSGKLRRAAATTEALSVEPRPAAEMSAHMAAADLLVSPRAGGFNVPLKIYSYLKSRRPIVATDIPAHAPLRGVPGAFLAPPEPRPFATALRQGFSWTSRRTGAPESEPAAGASASLREPHLPTPAELHETLEALLVAAERNRAGCSA